MELWAGVECTVNRVCDRYFDQMARSGHDRRDDDIDLFTWIGAKAVRIGILWERIAPHGLRSPDWSWSDRRLEALRRRGLRPIVGLLHHGSGPIDTSLVDPHFCERFADYAQAVAERYPWVTDYTPINEPLTTARFSGMYGTWFPHGTDTKTFIAALLNQIRATVAAMRRIRAFNPRARLIQTEDLGKVHSTPDLGYQADFENERRWLTFDALSGRVRENHPLWNYLMDVGADADVLMDLVREPCPPDIIGINHYVTSERWLDHRLDLYPAHLHGGNGRDRYVDVEAARACALAGPEALLRETWERFRLPIAITEVHLGCTREEHLRWFRHVWKEALSARDRGVDVQAITTWALLGSFDWDSLVTSERGHYEAGAFDVRSGKPRPTATAKLLRAIGHGESFDHPVLDTPGWWHRPLRILYPAVDGVAHRDVPDHARPLLILGAGGTLGNAFVRLCALRGLRAIACKRRDLDITDRAAIERALSLHAPWAVINAAGYVRVDDAEHEPEACRAMNVAGPVNLATACASLGLPLLTFSSDLVFDGSRPTPYVESNSTRPLNTYGRTKAEAESLVLSIYQSALVVRTAAFFGPWDAANFLAKTVRDLRNGRQIRAIDDVVISPTYVPDLVNAALDLLIDGESGLWHLSNSAEVTWFEFARVAAELTGSDRGLLRPISLADSGLAAARPVYRPLGSERGPYLRSLDEALGAWWSEVQPHFDDQRAARRDGSELTLNT